MLFNSLVFIIFLICVLIIYYRLQNWKFRKIFLLGASYFFYASSNPIFIIFLIFSTILDWFLAKNIYKTNNIKLKKLNVFFSIFANLGLLLYFKAGEFILDYINPLFDQIEFIIPYHPENILIPIGISFYTFQTISFTIDVYRQDVEIPKSFWDYALYVSFFPQLVAGPIIRSGDFFPQCQKSKSFDLQAFSWGVFLLILGLFQKVVLSDVILSKSVNLVFSNAKLGLYWVDAWIGSLALGGQIFLDFSGYSTCAIGIGLMLGFSIKDNFRYPLAAYSFSEFWKRWHISLYSWFKDYLFIPLGGSRVGTGRLFFNILLVTILSGLWHRFSLTFLCWGLCHGFFIIIEIIFKKIFSNFYFFKTNSSKNIFRIIVLLVNSSSLVFFRAQDLEGAFAILRSMFNFSNNAVTVIPSIYIFSFLIVYLPLILSHWYFYDKQFTTIVDRTSHIKLITIITFMLFALIIAQGKGNDFIYFQF